MLVAWHPVIFPLGFAVVTVFLKLLSRRNSDLSPFRNDCYVGQSMVLGSFSSCLVFLIKAIIAHNWDGASDLVFLMMFLLILTVVMAFLDRFYGWESIAGIERREMVWGIVVPNVLSSLVMLGVFVFAKTRAL